MPSFRFWFEPLKGITWSLAEAPTLGQELALGNNVYRVGELLERDRRGGNAGAYAGEYAVELVRAATSEEVMAAARALGDLRWSGG